MSPYLIAAVAAALMVLAKGLVFRWLMAKAAADAAARTEAETGER